MTAATADTELDQAMETIYALAEPGNNKYINELIVAAVTNTPVSREAEAYLGKQLGFVNPPEGPDALRIPEPLREAIAEAVNNNYLRAINPDAPEANGPR